LSFGSFEIPHLLGLSWSAQTALLRQNPWLVPLVIGLGLLGLLQPILLLAITFRPRLFALPGDGVCRVRIPDRCPRARRWVAAILACNIVFQIGLATARLTSDPWTPRRSDVHYQCGE